MPSAGIVDPMQHPRWTRGRLERLEGLEGLGRLEGLERVTAAAAMTKLARSVISWMVVTGVLATPAWSQTTGGAPRTLVIPSMSGSDLFRFYCASCHGPDGKGHGPVEQALKASPPDLTAIARRNGGRFPAQRVEAILEGAVDPTLAAHGSRAMPVWGPIFRALDANDKANRARVASLVRHLESLQRVD